jgi:ElaB/YqjD/DUF883 family membrane-anchored ribosome-binding protein
MIEAAMLVALGFLAAGMLVLLVAPAFWSRAVRLTTLRLRNTMPLTEAEIRADKDLMRAEYAVRVHQLEKQVERAKLDSHRQMIEINRREQRIARLDSEKILVTAELEENQNARRVLEQTINDRLPKLELRLDEARRLLRARDQEISELGHLGTRQEAALDELRGINQQQSAEIERLKAYLNDFQTRDRRRPADGETDFALRSELEQLRTRSREQADLIERLQVSVATGVAPAQIGALDGDTSVLRGKVAEQAAEIRRLQSELEAALAGPQADAKGGIKESKAFLKARLDRVEGDLEATRQQLARLKAELAAANEKAARQASHYVEEMRRFTTRAASTPRIEPPSPGLVAKLARPGGAGKAEPAGGTTTVAEVASLATARARELQQALKARVAPAARNGASEVVDHAANADEPAAATVAETVPEGAAPAETGEARGRLLDRLRTYDEA